MAGPHRLEPCPERGLHWPMPSAGARTPSHYNYYPGSYRLHSMREGSDGYLYLADGSGNVPGLIDSGSGAVHASYSYTPFGRSDQAWQPGENRFRFASSEVDRLGLYYFRARYYSPELRRFISEDPIGLAGGVNPYMYAGNDPINQSDPTGLLSQECVEDGTHNCPYRLGVVTGRVRMRGVTLPVSRSPWGWLVPGSLDVDAILAEAGGVWRAVRQKAGHFAERAAACKTEIGAFGVSLGADALFVTTGGLAATGRLGAFAWKAVTVSSRLGRIARPALGIGGRAIGAFPLMVEGSILGAGLMGAGVPWTTYEGQRVMAAAHKAMAGSAGAIHWQDFVPVIASIRAGASAFNCLF